MGGQDDAPDFTLIWQDSRLEGFPFILPILELESDDHASTVEALTSLLSTPDNEITPADVQGIFNNTLEMVQWLRPSFGKLQASTLEDQVTLVKAFLCANSKIMHCIQEEKINVDSDVLPGLNMNVYAPIWIQNLCIACEYIPSFVEKNNLSRALDQL